MSEPLKWRVERHSGRGSLVDWRIVYDGDDEQKARRIYADTEAKMRQGGVALRRPDGRTEFIKYAPRNRTRW